MGVKKTESKIPIYKINSKEKLLNYYANWTDKDQYNQDMIDWNYQAPINSSQLLNKYNSMQSHTILYNSIKLYAILLHSMQFQQEHCLLDAIYVIRIPKNLQRSLLHSIVDSALERIGKYRIASHWRQLPEVSCKDYVHSSERPRVVVCIYFRLCIGMPDACSS